MSRIDVLLDPQHVYAQVIAKSGAQHGVLYLLTVARTKRLAILELKATENPELPLQAAPSIVYFGRTCAPFSPRLKQS